MSENPIALVIAENPVLAITDKEKFAEFMKDIRAEIDAHKPDVSTVKGRSEISSLAFKVTRTKTAIDKAGKELNSAKRKEIDAVDAERRAIWDKLEALATEVRAPLTEWEEKEKTRQEKIAAVLEDIKTFPWVAHVSESIRAAIAHIEAIEIDPEIFQDELSVAVLAKQERLTALREYLDAAIKHEADQAELQRLRDEAEARAQADREREQAAIAAKQEADRIEREKAEADKRERDRLAAIEEAAENARREEARKAQAEQDARDKTAKAEIDRVNRENEALRQKENERQQQAEREEKERQKREKDREHRGKIMKLAKEAIMSHGASETIAKNIILAIVAGEIPNVRIEF